MRVVLCDTGRTWRGGQRQVTYLAAHLADERIPVSLWTSARSPLSSWARDRGIPVVAERRAGNDLSLSAARSLGRWATRWRPSVVHAHDGRAHAIGRLAQVLGMAAPLLVTRRVTRVPRSRWKYVRGGARYIAVSDAVRRSLVAGGVPPHRIVRIASGVPVPAAHERRDELLELGIHRAMRVAVVVSALSGEKGVATGIGAAARLRADPRFRMVVVGDGPARASLETLARRLDAPVSFAGFRHDPGPILRRADILVHTPLAEGLGGAVLEGLARGVPVVATDVGGLREIVRPGIGTLVPANRPDRVAQHIAAWLGDDARRVRARDIAIRTAMRHTDRRMTERTVDLYDTLARCGRARGV